MNDTPDEEPATAPQDSSKGDHNPTPAEVVAAILRSLRHYCSAKRKASRWIDVAGLIVNVLIAVAAFYSAWLFQGQLKEARRASDTTTRQFMQDERAWVEIEPIKPMLLDSAPKFGATFTCDIYPKNVGKTVATDVVVKANSVGSSEELGNSRSMMANGQNKYLLDEFTEMGTGNPVHVPQNPVPKVLAPNTTSAAPFRLTCQEPGNGMIHYLIGRIDYCDQFQVKHWLKFCYFVVNARGEIWNCQEGNDEDRNPEAPTPATACANPN
jgi:hypothetical protein